MNKIKIVIWDLDDTMWKGILAEGRVELIEGRVELLNNLVDRGIMNSIASKNDFNSAKAKLEKYGIYDLFIFPTINYEGKGINVRQILTNANLRAENALFIDDSMQNRKEVEFYNQGIMTASPEEIDSGKIIQFREYGVDSNHHRERLQQYKVMELRMMKKAVASSDKDFLIQSDICIDIKHDCLSEEKRIAELIDRTNQLNYTKKRLSRAEVHALLIDESFESSYVIAKDRYGHYGVVGFFSLRNNILEHYLFSCRILGLGIEQYIYHKLGRPQITVGGEVAIELEGGEIEWIREDKIAKSSDDGRGKKTVLMIGGCDLEGMKYYVSDKCVKTEFSTAINGVEYKRSYTSLMLGTVRYSKEIKEVLSENIPFIDNKISFSSEVFSGKYRTIVLSLADDFICKEFRYLQNPNVRISIGDYYDENDQEVLIKRYGARELKWFYDNFELLGNKKTEDLYFDLKDLAYRLSRNVELVLVNGIDLDLSEWIGKERVGRNLEINKVIDRIVEECSNVKLLDLRRIVCSTDDLPRHDNRHFSRRVYYEMARFLNSIISDEIEIIDESRIIVETDEMIKKCGGNQVYCYGAGNYGKVLGNWLKRNGINLVGFVDTDEYKWGTTILDEMYIKDLDSISKDVVILVSVSQQYKDEILFRLKKAGMEHYYVLSEDCWEEIEKCAHC